MPDERSIRMSSVLGESALVIGNVEGQGDLEVRGRIQGDVVLEGRLLIAQAGSVLGTVEAINVTVSGELRGDVIASDNVLVTAGARIEGNIAAPRVAIEPGASVRGQLNTTDAPGVRGAATAADEQEDVPQARHEAHDDRTPGREAQFREAQAREAQAREVQDDEAQDVEAQDVEAQDDETQGTRKPRRRRRRKRNGSPQPSGAAASPGDESAGDESAFDSAAAPAPPRSKEDGGRNGRQGPVPIEEASHRPQARSSAGPRAGRSEKPVPDVDAELRVGPRKMRGGKPPRLPTFVKGAKGRMRGA